jgi:hypothetical protein
MTRSKKQSNDLEKLISLGPKRIAKMLLERAEWDEGTACKVEQALSESDPVKTVVSKVKKGLGQYTNSRLAGAWRMSSVVSKELEHLRVLIVESVLPKAPDTAASLLEKLIDRNVPVFNNVDDSYGAISDVFRQAVQDWGNAWSRCKAKDTTALARKVYDKHIANDYGVYDEIVPAFGEALRENGLAVLEKLALDELKKLPPIPEGDRARHFDENWSVRCRIGHIMEGIADIRKDPDSFIEAVRVLGRDTIHGVEIAERFIDAGRFEEALEWLSRNTGVQRTYEIPYLKAKCLIALSRKNEARDVLWKHFLETFTSNAYKEALSLAKPEDIKQMQREALTSASKSNRLLDALSFLAEEKFLREAATLVLERWKEINGSVYTTLGDIAKKLAKDYPLSSVVLHRLMAEAVLDKGISKYYGYAIRDLRSAERLGLEVTEWHDFKNNEEYIQELRGKHRLKKSLWERYEK